MNSIREARTPRPAFNLAAVLGARQRRRTLIGLLIMSVIFVVAVLIFLMDPLRRALRDEVELVALFDSAPSIGRGAAVWIAGHEAGRVETLEFLPLAGDTSPRLALLLRIPRDRLPMLRADATVRISSASVAGDPAVDILPGNADAPPLQPGDTLRAEPTLTRAELRQRVARVRAASDSLRMESRPLAAAARERMIGLARVQTRFARVPAGLDELSRTIDQSPLTAFTASDDVGRALERLRLAGGVVADARGAESGMQRTAAAFQPFLAHSAELRARIDSLMARAGPNGTLARLQSDSAIAVALRRTRVQLDSLIADARANPFRYVF